MVRNSISGRIRWTFSDDNPVIAPGQLHADMDSRRAGAATSCSLATGTGCTTGEPERTGFTVY